MISSRLRIIFSLALCIRTILCGNCDSFNNVKVKWTIGDSDSKETVVNGCLRPGKVNNKITGVEIFEQKLTRLGKKSVTHLQKLKVFSIMGTDLEELERQSFTDLPSLKEVWLRNSNIKLIPKDVFNTVTSLNILVISNNQINSIESQAFANMPSLRIVEASNNSLEYWSGNWFENTNSLEVLRFDNNKIRTIPSGAFPSPMPNISDISFRYNEIATIEREAFHNIEGLYYLDLSYNKLILIHDNVFPNKININSFAITANYLNYLSNDLLKKLSVRRIFLDYNPWNCRCLERIYFWINKMSSSLWKDKPVCNLSLGPICAVSSSGDPQICIEQVDNELTRRYTLALSSVSLPPGGRETLKNCP